MDRFMLVVEKGQACQPHIKLWSQRDSPPQDSLWVLLLVVLMVVVGILCRPIIQLSHNCARDMGRSLAVFLAGIETTPVLVRDCHIRGNGLNGWAISCISLCRKTPIF